MYLGNVFSMYLGNVCTYIFKMILLSIFSYIKTFDVICVIYTPFPVINMNSLQLTIRHMKHVTQ